MITRKRLVLFVIPGLVLVALSGTVNANEPEEIEATDTALFASAQELSAAEIC